MKWIVWRVQYNTQQKLLLRCLNKWNNSGYQYCIVRHRLYICLFKIHFYLKVFRVSGAGYLHLIYTIDLGAFLIPVLKYLAAVKLKAYLLDCVCSNAKC